jgi:hypothetical protein
LRQARWGLIVGLTRHAHCRRAALRSRRGQSLVEFALIALVLYVLLAAVLEFGRLLHGAQTVQGAVDQAAREISRVPLPPADDFLTAMQDPRFQTVYSEDFLVIDLSNWTDPTQGLVDYLDSLAPPMPPINKALVPLMFVAPVGGKSMLRYPGALVTSDTAPSGLTVMVPLLTAGSMPGVGPESIVWHRVLEEIPDSSGSGGPFSLTWVDPSGNNVPGGLVAVRLNYPFQAASMSGFQANPNGPFEPTIGSPMMADDGGVTAVNAVPNGGTPVAPDQPAGQYAGTYGGTYGLGEQGALAQTVRPFRRVISAQAIFRREVFGP